MQIQLDHIACSERLVWQVREEPFVDHAFSCDSNRTLLFPCGMRRSNDARALAIGPDWDLWTVGEAAHHVTFGALLELVGRQVQACLNEWMVEQTRVFPAGHQREASHIGEDRSIALLPVTPDQRAFWWELRGSQRPANGRESLASFLPRASVPTVAETAEPMGAVRLRHGGPRPDCLSAFATSIARCTDLVQPTKSRRQVLPLRESALPRRFPRPINVKDFPGVPHAIQQFPRLPVGCERASEQIIEKERAQRFDGSFGERCQNAREG